MIHLNNWIAMRYGSKTGLIKASIHRLLNLLGIYRAYTDIQWQDIERVVFVCKGNICRSAYAEAVACSLGYDVISCGVDTIADAKANTDAIKVAQKRGVDLTLHRTTPAKKLTLKETDLVVAMEPWHIDRLKVLFGEGHHYTLLGLWGSPQLPYLPDPYGCSLTYFDTCFEYIDMCLNNIFEKI